MVVGRMFNNTLNRNDLRHLVRRLRREGVRKAAGYFLSRRDDRVAEFWSTVEHEPTHSWNVPAVLRRRNALITGEESTSPADYVVKRHLGDRAALVGMSIGCGEGSRERVWARTGRFSRIDAYDVSPSDIDAAREHAKSEGLDAVLNFQLGDIYKLDYEPESLDLVIAEDALHHMTPLKELLARFERWLRPDGLLFVNEYVGPRRLQMRPRQLEAANALLTLLPESCRREWGSDRVKTRVQPDGWLRVYLKDPSEAVESDRIVPLLRERFDVIEERPYGETIVDPVLLSIAPNFAGDDQLARKALHLMFSAEELLLEAGELESMRTVVICRKRARVAQT